MNILSRIGTIAQPFIAATSEMFRKPSDKVSEPVSDDPEAISTKPLRDPTPNNLPVDGRKKPRSANQIETYKKNFTNRHKPRAPIKTVQQPTIYDEIFS